MFVSDKVIQIFEIAKDTVDDLRSEVRELGAENGLLKQQLSKSEILSDWLRVKVNQLELQNAALLEKAYNIKVPVPEIARRPSVDPTFDPKNFSLDDMGDTMARQLGFPSYDEKSQ